MARVTFTQNLQRHVQCPPVEVAGGTVRDVLENVFEKYQAARGFVLDDQGAVRKHVVIFVNGQQIQDRIRLADPVAPDSEVYVMQALSGG
jgi:sulfur-carrier protein